MIKNISRKRYRNNPPIRVIIEKYLKGKEEASIVEIYKHIQQTSAKLVSKKPKNSVYSIIARMPNVERVRYGKYRLKA